MQKIIKIGDQNIVYTLRRNRRARNLRIIIHGDGGVVVSVPRIVPQIIINQFVINKSEWILDKIKHFSRLNIAPRQTKKQKRDEYLIYKEKALALAKERLEHFNKFYNLKWNRVSIKNQKTRWGSCSRRGNLNFNYKIALLPQQSADYIVVHELCHLKELNHSERFWSLVEKTIPDYLEIRKSLRKDGYTLG